ncbi:MAG: adenylate/guanylate cyclase domain-containing protein, partial [Microscillaceae bacterium]|nr:adenylate/guanylate cyclase domain-containing protein [Microscillaceae bacterium]
EGRVRVHEWQLCFCGFAPGAGFWGIFLLESDAKSRSASVTAVVSTRLLRLSQDAFYELMANRIEIVKGILAVLIKRSRRQNYYEEKMNEQSRELERQRDLIEKEKEKSEKLLLNILPVEVADELKAKGRAEVHQYEQASVLFADIKGFTESAAVMSPAEVLRALEFYFNAFDEIMDHHDIEKIKTIGDAYMCAGGIPVANHRHPIDIVLAALEMQQFMKDNFLQHPIANGQIPHWEVRIGINTGPLIAGVIGKKKFVYDIWGDTVNIASRLESSGVVNRINISASTYELVKDFFVCQSRGLVNAKGKGEIPMYFVDAIQGELSEEGQGIRPNPRFYEKLAQKANIG